MGLILHGITKKWRITHYIVKFVRRYNTAPIKPQGVSLYDVGVALEGQEVQIHVDNALCFHHHLIFCYPKGGFGYGCSKIVDFYAVELMNRYLYGIGYVTQDNLLP